jgi:hypothetical protein
MEVAFHREMSNDLVEKGFFQLVSYAFLQHEGAVVMETRQEPGGDFRVLLYRQGNPKKWVSVKHEAIEQIINRAALKGLTGEMAAFIPQTVDDRGVIPVDEPEVPAA